MTRVLLSGILLALTLAGAPAPLQAGKSVSLVPSGAAAVKVTVGKRQHTYYALTASGKMRIQVEGPGRITLISRLQIPAGSGEKSYGVVIKEKGAVVARQKTTTGASKATIKEGGTALGKLRKLSLRVPPGSHTYEIALENGASAVAKVLYQSGKAPKKMAYLEARSYDRIATAVVKEQLRTYYVTTKNKGVQLRVVGPTKVRVSTRVNFDTKMTGRQKYGVAVWEKDKRILLKSLVGGKSQGAAYKDWKEVVPGKVVSFTLPVPAGEHWYTFRIEEGTASSVALRFAIPERDLKNKH